jgi:hypothetical protein
VVRDYMIKRERGHWAKKLFRADAMVASGVVVA